MGLREVHSCERKTTLETQKNLITTLSAQNEQLEKILSGESENKVLVTSFFPLGFKVEDTEKEVTRLKTLNEKSAGLSEVSQNHVECLKKLKLEKDFKKLSELAIAVNLKKIDLFQKNAEQEGELKTNLDAQSSLPALKDEISKENRESEKIRKTLEEGLIKSESQTINEKDINKKEILNVENLLTRYRIDLISRKIRQNKDLEEKINFFDEKSKRVEKISSSVETSEAFIAKNYEEIDKVWREITKVKFVKLIEQESDGALPKVPEIPEKLLSMEQAEIAGLISQREELLVLRRESISELAKKRSEEIRLLNNLVVQVNSARSRFYSKLSSSQVWNKFFSRTIFKDLRDELFASPYRIISFFYAKFLYLSENVQKGKEGYYQLIRDLFTLFFYFLGLLALNTGFKKIYQLIDSNQQMLIQKFGNFFFSKMMSSVWSRLKSDTVIILWLILLYFARESAKFDQLIILVDLALVYYSSRILKSIVIMFLGSVSRLDMSSFLSFKKKANETAISFANIYLFYFITMIFVHATVGKVLIYTLVNIFALLYALYRLIVASSAWEKEFSVYMEKKFSGVIIEKLDALLDLLPSRLKATLMLLSILVLSILDIFIRSTENFEISKKISANLFKKQIEKIEAEDGADDRIPADYKELFSLTSLTDESEYVTTSNKLEDKIKNEIDEWITEKSDEHSVVVYGDKGVGKTTLLKHVSEKYSSEEVKFHYMKIPSKTLDEESLLKALGESLGSKKENFNLYEYDKSLEKKLVLVIDEAQNVFLSETGGFNAYYALVNIVNYNTENIFWLLSFNKYSWLFLDRAFGRTQYFRNVFEVKGWTDLSIKELIMKRHKKSRYRLSYDLLINATRSQDEIDRYSSIESKFFKLLWELSRGNPRLALYLWLTALSRRGLSSFNVNIPKEYDASLFDNISDDLLFVLSHIFKHENLSAKELERTTDLPHGVVRNSIKLGLEKKMLYRDERRRYMIDISSQFGLIRHLRVKNFIYGN